MNDIESLMTELAQVSEEKQRILEQETDIKAHLLQLMGQDNIKKLENARITVNYVDAFTRYSVDSERLKRDFPDAAKQCMKSSVVNPFIKVKVNG